MTPDRRPELRLVDCSLPTRELPERLEAWHAVAGRAMAYDVTERGVRLMLPAEPALARRVEELVRLEADCCTFFTFSVTLHGATLVLDVSAPLQARPMIDELLGRQFS